MEIITPTAVDALWIVLRTLAIFCFTYLVLRMLGRKRLTQFGIMDLLLIIALGSAVGDVMIYSEGVVPVLTSIIAIGTVGILIRGYDELIDRYPQLQHLFSSSPVIIVRDGGIVEEVLHDENITKEQLLSTLRAKGYIDISYIDKAILEPNGEVSVHPYRW